MFDPEIRRLWGDVSFLRSQCSPGGGKCNIGTSVWTEQSSKMEVGFWGCVWDDWNEVMIISGREEDTGMQFVLFGQVGDGS